MNPTAVHVSEDAWHDLNEGRSFYNSSQEGVGDYFYDSLIADIESLIIYGGIHPQHFGCYRMLSTRFPYAIYYVIKNNHAWILAVLPLRRDPAWISTRLNSTME